MAERKTVAILGLGIFGSTLAKDLCRYNVDVIAVDKDMSSVERISEFVNNAVCLDFTDINQLKAVGVGDADIGIVTSGSLLEESIMGILNLKELGVERIIAKSKNRKYSEILKKIGADETVSPEKSFGKSLAKKLVSKDILELFDLDNDYTIFDMKVPTTWTNKSLIELNLRNKYNLNVIGVRRNDKLLINFDPNEKILENDEILAVGENEIFKNFDFNK